MSLRVQFNRRLSEYFGLLVEKCVLQERINWLGESIIGGSSKISSKEMVSAKFKVEVASMLYIADLIEDTESCLRESINEIMPFRGLFLGDVSAALSEKHFDLYIKVLAGETDHFSSAKFKGKLVDVGVEDRSSFEDLLEKIRKHFSVVSAEAGLQRIFKKIDWALLLGQSVLVFCKHGYSRSASLVMAYAIDRFKLNYDEALDLVRMSRPQVDLGFGFAVGVRDYADILK